MEQNHLGKFLKLSSLDFPLIEYQIFNFAKESLKQVFLNSKCGEIINGKEFKDKPSNSHLINSKNIYPLYFVYKKSKPKIKIEKNILSWKDYKTKKQIDIMSNSYFTLSLLILSEYYGEFIKDEKTRKDVVKFYVCSAKCQLNYYVENFRNELGLFVDKKLIENKDDKKYSKPNFECLDENFNFPSQAFLMCSFLKCSKMLKDNSPYKIPFLNFSIEMKKMFVKFKEELTKQKSKYAIDTINALTFYILENENPEEEILNILFELIENFTSNHSITSLETNEKIILYQSFVNLKSFMKNFNHENNSIMNLLCEYIWEFEEVFSKKDFVEQEILNTYDLILFQLYLCKFQREKSQKFFEESLLPSKIFSCFPNIPKKYESEKYFQFEHNKNSIIPDKYIKPYNYKTMDETNLTPIILKSKKDKTKFSKPKIKFHSLLNMKLIFLILSNLKSQIIKTIK